MTGGARHGIGAGIGIVSTPVLFALLVFGTERLIYQYRYVVSFLYRDEFARPGTLLGALLLLLLAAGVAALVATRVSPVASLIPGAVFTLHGLLWAVLPGRAIRMTSDLPVLGRDYDLALGQIGSLGVTLLIGVVLVAGSVVPSRWRTAPASGPGRQAQPHGPAFAAPARPAPYGAQPGPYGSQPAAQPGQWGQGPQQPWQQPQPGRPQPGQPQPAQPQPAQPHSPYGQPQPQPGSDPSPGGARHDQPQNPALPASGKDEGTAPRSGGSTPGDDEPGEWTRVYGGGDDRPPPPA
ncbi:hypothetical protein Acsp04_63380 [Actinomadura sp. NBRC 104425]|uniref:hypothetical protein n=1 Tax=Actinomadura sp. NBRC 104425 TaxID=3032204 RepID=UPI0024A05970|nr:hypothetical protein [Actinomadura sp. NBRC 104425]GLZ16103.1 hypothetical protein Acsp04_63380 [Actinomadura sp. NBRC 104425]